MSGLPSSHSPPLTPLGTESCIAAHDLISSLMMDASPSEPRNAGPSQPQNNQPPNTEVRFITKIVKYIKWCKRHGIAHHRTSNAMDKP